MRVAKFTIAIALLYSADTRSEGGCRSEQGRGRGLWVAPSRRTRPIDLRRTRLGCSHMGKDGPQRAASENIHCIVSADWYRRNQNKRAPDPYQPERPVQILERMGCDESHDRVERREGYDSLQLTQVYAVDRPRPVRLESCEVE